eukprot:5847635-Amphidinium_carterae.1
MMRKGLDTQLPPELKSFDVFSCIAAMASKVVAELGEHWRQKVCIWNTRHSPIIKAYAVWT